MYCFPGTQHPAALLLTSTMHGTQVGAEELDPESYKSASDLRAKLHEASRCRSALENAVKAVQKTGRPEDAEGVDKVG